MSPQKNKKLEAAIDNLFSSPRTRAVAPKKNAQMNDPGAQPEVEKEIEAQIYNSQVEIPPPPSQPAAPPTAEVVVEESVISAPVLAVDAVNQQEIPSLEVVEIPSLEAVEITPAAAMAGIPAVSPQGGSPVAPSAPPPAKTPDQVLEGSVQMVIFTLEGQYYGIAIEAVDSIIKMQAITELPHAPHYIVGLTNLRGKVLPVISLRRRFDFEDQEPTKNSRIIVISVDQKEAGLIVDGVSEVETILNQNIEPTPEMMENSNSRPINGIAKLTDRLIILLNLSKLISPGAQSGSFI